MKQCDNQVTVLSSKKNSCLVKCACCGCYQVSFKNLIMNFQKEQIEKFRNIFINDQLVYSDEPTYNNKKAMIKCVAESDVYLAFDEKEIKELKELLEEAFFLDEAYKLISAN